MEEAHTIKWEDGEVVNHNLQYRQRCTLEAWHIHMEQHKMNRDEGPLPALLLIHLTATHMLLIFYALPLHVSVFWIHVPAYIAESCGKIVILFHFTMQGLVSFLATHLFLTLYIPAVCLYRICYLSFVSVNFH